MVVRHFNNIVLTEVQKYVCSVKQCWLLLQAAQYDNCKSVTTCIITESRSCSVTKPPTPFRFAHSQFLVIATHLTPNISLCNAAADVLQHSANAPFWHPNFRKNYAPTFHPADVNSHNCCWRSITGNLWRRSNSWLETGFVSLNFARDSPVPLFRRDECLNISVFHCSLHTADTFQASVLFSLSFYSYTKPSPVSTDHYFCCYVLWTNRLHREITLLVKEWNNGLMTTELLQ